MTSSHVMEPCATLDPTAAISSKKSSEIYFGSSIICQSSKSDKIKTLEINGIESTKVVVLLKSLLKRIISLSQMMDMMTLVMMRILTLKVKRMT